MVGWALAGPSGTGGSTLTDDGQTWNAAELSVNRSPYIWTVWKYRFAPPERGRYHVRVRATDGDGHSQPPSDPDRAAGDERAGPSRIGGDDRLNNGPD